MNNKFKNILTILLCLVLVAASVFAVPVNADTTDSEASQTDEDEVKMKKDFLKAANFKSRGKVDDWDIAYEDANSQLLVNTSTAAVAVLNKEDGKIWSTNPTESQLEQSGVADIYKGEIRSQLVLTYTDSANNETNFQSYDYGVKDGRYEINNTEKGVRVDYNVGKDTNEFLFPDCLTVKTYNELKSKMSAADAKTFESYYRLYEKDNLDEKTALQLTVKYPLLSSQDIYVTKTNAKKVRSDFYKKVLSELDGINIDEDWIEENYKEIGYTAYTLPDAPNFDVTIEYKVENGKLTASIPEDGIVYKTKKYKLIKVNLLPYFGVDYSNGSLLFMPDGTGAIIDTAANPGKAFSTAIYGNDRTMRTKDFVENPVQATLPVFGMVINSSAFIANISNGAELGTVTAYTKGDKFHTSRIFTSFSVHEFEEYVSNGSAAGTTIRRYAEDMYSRPITIDYYFLSGDNANYVGMAQKIRGIYFGDKQKLNSNNVKFLLETYGGVIRKDIILAFPIYKYTPFSTISQVKSMYNELTSGGVKNIDIKYNNWSVDKYQNSLSKIGNLQGKLGSTNDWKDLESYLGENGSKIYATVDLVRDKNSKAVFDASWHCKQLDGTLVEYAATNGIYTKGITDSYFLTAITTAGRMNKLSDIFKKLNKLNIDSVAYDSVGEYIFSDFNGNNEQLRDQVVEGYREMFDKAKAENQNIMVSVGNAYTLKYADMISDIPMGCSGTSIEYGVPFLQIVLHGYVDYVGKAVNLAANSETEYLKSIEYGAGLSYVLTNAEPKMIKDTNYSDLYSTYYENWRSDVITKYTKAEAVLGSVQSSVITNHENLQSGVYCTTYENGLKVVVNYNNYDVDAFGTTVKAKDFVGIK